MASFLWPTGAGGMWATGAAAIGSRLGGSLARESSLVLGGHSRLSWSLATLLGQRAVAAATIFIRHFPDGLSLEPIQARNGPHFNNAPPRSQRGMNFRRFFAAIPMSWLPRPEFGPEQAVCGFFTRAPRRFSLCPAHIRRHHTPTQVLRSRVPTAGSPVARCDPESRRTSYVSPPPRPVGT